jgi:thiol-disulfide isomerase/thioredoxin
LQTEPDIPSARPRRKLWVGVVALAVAAAGAGVAWRLGVGDSALVGTARQDGATLLALVLPDAAGKETAIAQWKGRVLVVNFWATWCAPCRDEMPRFVELQQTYGSRGLQFVGVAIDQADKVRAFEDEIHLNYPSLIGGYGAIELSKTLGNRLGALPFTVILDRSGRITHTQLGPVKDSQLRSIIDQLL